MMMNQYVDTEYAFNLTRPEQTYNVNQVERNHMQIDCW